MDDLRKTEGRFEATLENGDRILADTVVAAPGISSCTVVPDRVERSLHEHFQTSVDGLFVTGFAATRDSGPFFGFVRGSSVAASLTTAGVREALG